jgi:hypothetical protein
LELLDCWMDGWMDEWMGGGLFSLEVGDGDGPVSSSSSFFLLLGYATI